MTENRICLFAFFLLLITACKSPKASVAQDVPLADTSGLSEQLRRGNQAPIDVFLSRFELAVLSRNGQRVMPFMDKSYRTEQHDSLLKKNTAEFLNIFFGGYSADGRYISRTDFNKITGLKRKSMEYTQNSYLVTYTISTGNSIHEASWVVLTGMRGEYLVFGLYGPVGIPE